MKYRTAAFSARAETGRRPGAGARWIVGRRSEIGSNGHGINDRSVGSNNGAGREMSGLKAVFSHDMENRLPSCDQIVGNDTAMAAPPDGLGTHDRAAPFASFVKQVIQARPELPRQRIIGVVAKAVVGPEAVDARGRVSHLSAKAAERGHVFIANVEGCQSAGKRLLVELRIGARPRKRSDIGNQADLGACQQFHEQFETSVRMADREERRIHAALPVDARTRALPSTTGELA